MMVLVDTTVWIDFFAARSLGHVVALENLIRDREDICTCGIVLTEVTLLADALSCLFECCWNLQGPAS